MLVIFLTWFSLHANAAEQKPDEFAHHHYSAKSAPPVDNSAARKAALEKLQSDSFGTSAAAPAAISIPVTREVQGQYPPVVICQVQHSNSRYLVRDSDGVDECAALKGELMAGREEDRGLPLVTRRPK